MLGRMSQLNDGCFRFLKPFLSFNLLVMALVENYFFLVRYLSLNRQQYYMEFSLHDNCF